MNYDTIREELVSVVRTLDSILSEVEESGLRDDAGNLISIAHDSAKAFREPLIKSSCDASWLISGLFEPLFPHLSRDRLRKIVSKIPQNFLRFHQPRLNQRFLSGAWIGYHANIYYSNLSEPPPGAMFDPGWGYKADFPLVQWAIGPSSLLQHSLITSISLLELRKRPLNR